MKILFLGYGDCKLINFLRTENEVFQTTERVSFELVKEFEPELIISYGYTHIIRDRVLQEYEGRIINLHISYLPWNRGMYPNIWSVIDNTPKGVTIHLIDAGLDTGDIIFQRKVEIGDNDTLATSYWKLRDKIENLFVENWSLIKNLNFERIQQEPGGTFHLKKTSEKYFKYLGIMNKWGTTVRELKEKSDEDIINEVQKIRAKNNTHWMDVVKLAFRTSPIEARQIFKNIKYCDEKINVLLNELADND